jgi:acyl carrier protein
MEPQAIYTQLTEVFRDLFDDDELVVTAETTAADVPGWNSLMHINLILGVEVRFKIKFRTSEIEAMHSVGHLADIIDAKLKQQSRER